MSRNAGIIDDNSNIFKLLQNSSLSKSANIPMIVVKTFIPSNTSDENEIFQVPSTSKFSGFKLFSNMQKQKQFKQIEIHRGMTINALFSRESWLFIKTAQNESGYVPLDSCRPVIKRHNNNNDSQLIDSTCVSLLEMTFEKKNYDEMLFDDEDENLSELEFSQYDNEYKKLKHYQMLNNEIINESQQRLFKIKHYFKSLEVETNISPGSESSNSSSPINSNSIAIDSGYSDCDSNIIATKQTELLIKPTRRGIKTNGSICSISPNPTPNELVIMQTANKELVEAANEPKVEILSKPIIKPNLSTIIEQSYNSSVELQRSYSNSYVGNNSVVIISNKCDVSNLQNNSLSKSSINSSLDCSNYKIINNNYQPLFVDDLAVFKGENVIVLEDNNPEWCYVISQNGKGYIPRNCIQN
jgi:hypothetical protein